MDWHDLDTETQVMLLSRALNTLSNCPKHLLDLLDKYREKLANEQQSS